MAVHKLARPDSSTVEKGIFSFLHHIHDGSGNNPVSTRISVMGIKRSEAKAHPLPAVTDLRGRKPLILCPGTSQFCEQPKDVLCVDVRDLISCTKTVILNWNDR
jgi:hypothetical protein